MYRKVDTYFLLIGISTHGLRKDEKELGNSDKQGEAQCNVTVRNCRICACKGTMIILPTIKRLFCLLKVTSHRTALPLYLGHL